MRLLDYECQTTFWQDFSIAEKFGKEAIIDTYKRAKKEWGKDKIYGTNYGQSIMTSYSIIGKAKIWLIIWRLLTNNPVTVNILVLPILLAQSFGDILLAVYLHLGDYELLRSQRL